jgi:hypothetical protein
MSRHTESKQAGLKDLTAARTTDFGSSEGGCSIYRRPENARPSFIQHNYH